MSHYNKQREAEMINNESAIEKAIKENAALHKEKMKLQREIERLEKINKRLEDDLYVLEQGCL